MNSYALKIRQEINKIPKSQIFSSSDLYNKKFKDVPESTFYKTLERLCLNGFLVHESKGIYVRPLKTDFGNMPITEEDIIKKYTSNKRGMIIGYRLYNNKKITTQSPRVIHIYSNSIKENKKVIKNVVIKKLNISFTEEVIKTISVLEIIQDYFLVEERNPINFLKLIESFCFSYQEKVVDEVLSKIKYKKSTIASLKSFLDYYNIKNTLNKYLSSLSKYKIIDIGGMNESTSKFNFI